VNDRDTVIITEGQWELVCALSHGVIFSDIAWPQLPQGTLFSTILITFHIFIIGGNKYFKFGRQVDSSKFQLKDDKNIPEKDVDH